jgi:hypothetical protein
MSEEERGKRKVDVVEKQKHFFAKKNFIKDVE